MTDPIERELLEMLQEPTVVPVRRKIRERDVTMFQLGVALAPTINTLFVDLHERIKNVASDYSPDPATRRIQILDTPGYSSESSKSGSTYRSVVVTSTSST